jgi:hypothetical protein
MGLPFNVKFIVPVGAGDSTGLEVTVAVNVTESSTFEG